MDPWLLAGAGFLALCVPCAITIVRVDAPSRLVILQVTGTLMSLALFTVAIGLGQPSFTDLALTSALLAYPAGLLFARFFEVWL